jgi:hypothetical protein
MQLHAFPVDLLKDRVEYELERGIRPSFGRNFLENIFSCEACRKQRRKQGSALCIRKTFFSALFQTCQFPLLFWQKPLHIALPAIAGALVLASPLARNRVSAGGLPEAMIPRTLGESLPKLAQQLSEP